MTRTLVYQLHDLIPYINWIYFFHAWGLSPKMSEIVEMHDCVSCRRSWISKLTVDEQRQAVEAERLYKDAVDLLRNLDNHFEVKARFRLLKAWSDGEDIVVSVPVGEEGKKEEFVHRAKFREVHLPFLRQQKVSNSGAPCLCLADYIVPKSFCRGEKETVHFPVHDGDLRGRVIGLFATVVDAGMAQLYPEDDYLHMLAQVLSDRMAEAAAEKMHEEVRRKYWGYAPLEHLSTHELFAEKYEGRRPAVGYPSLPDQSFIFLIDELLEMNTIGIHLTDNGMMKPHAAVTGLMFDHPAFRHFSVGKIGEDQLQDYARRRKMSLEKCRKFLAANL